MSGFLSYIATQYGRKAEDVASDAVSYLMEDRNIRKRVSKYLKELGFPNLTADFKVRPRLSSIENGIPDLRLIERRAGCRVIIENKFGAPLTPKQPCAYLNEVSEDGLVLFVVPRWRLKGVWNELVRRCEEKYGPMTRTNKAGPGFIATSGSRSIAITHWDDLLKVLSEAGISNGSCGDDTAALIMELRRLCDVEQPIFKDFNPHLLTNTKIASSIYTCVPLLKVLINAAEDEHFFSPEKKEESGPGFFGEWGYIGDFRTWIGFDARLWSQKGESPFWIEFTDTEAIDENLRPIFNSARGKWSWLEEPNKLEDRINRRDHQLVIPIPLRLDVDYDEMLQAACKRVGEVAELLNLCKA